MSVVLQASPGATGLSLYALVFDDPNSSNKVWSNNLSVFVDFVSANRDKYAIDLPEISAGTNLYRATWNPPLVGEYIVQIYQKLGNSYEASDPLLQSGELKYEGDSSSTNSGGNGIAISTTNLLTVVGICNVALSRVGSSISIAILNEDSVEATLCNRFFAPLRDQLLRAYPWPFATRQISPGLVSLDPTSNWKYAYHYPNDAIAIQRISEAGEYDTYQREPYIISSDGSSGRLIYTNKEQAVVEYTAQITDARQYDPLFTSTLAWLLASELAVPLTGNAKLRNDALQIYQQEFAMAKAQADNELQRHPAPQIESEIITSRY